MSECVRNVSLFIQTHLVAVARLRSLQPCGDCVAGVARLHRAMADTQITYEDVQSSGVRVRCNRVAQRITAPTCNFQCVSRTSMCHSESSTALAS